MNYLEEIKERLKAYHEETYRMRTDVELLNVKYNGIETKRFFFVEPLLIKDIENFKVILPGRVDVDDLDKKIIMHSPRGVRYISDEEIDYALNGKKLSLVKRMR